MSFNSCVTNTLFPLPDPIITCIASFLNTHIVDRILSRVSRRFHRATRPILTLSLQSRSIRTATFLPLLRRATSAPVTVISLVSLPCALDRALERSLTSGGLAVLQHLSLVRLPGLRRWRPSIPLPALRRLHVTACRYHALPALLHQCPQLQHLQLQDIPALLNNDPKASSPSSSSSSSSSSSPSSPSSLPASDGSIPIPSSVESLVIDKCIPSCIPTPSTSSLSSSSSSLSLLHISFSRCPWLFDATLHSIIIACPHLNTLHLHTCSRIHRCRIVSHPSLTQVTFHTCTALHRPVISACPRLHTIQVQGCRSLVPDSMQAALAANPRLVVMAAEFFPEGWDRRRDYTFSSSCIRQLRLSVPDTDIYLDCPRLRGMHLQSSSSSSSVTPVSTSPPSSSSSSSSSGMDVGINTPRFTLDHHPTLISIHIVSVFLSRLSLRYCSSLRRIDVAACPSLQHVDLSDSTAVTDRVVQHLCQACRRLEVLNVSGTRVHQPVVEAPHLRFLYMTACPRLQQVELHAAALKHAHFTGSVQLTDMTLATPEMTAVYLAGCPSLSPALVERLRRMPSVLMVDADQIA